jgi:hypothetical protein
VGRLADRQAASAHAKPRGTGGTSDRCVPTELRFCGINYPPEVALVAAAGLPALACLARPRRRLVLGSFEFVGACEENGWKLAGTIVPIAYTAWSLWLIIAGVVLLAG